MIFLSLGANRRVRKDSRQERHHQCWNSEQTADDRVQFDKVIHVVLRVWVFVKRRS